MKYVVYILHELEKIYLSTEDKYYNYGEWIVELSDLLLTSENKNDCINKANELKSRLPNYTFTDETI